MTSPAPSAPTGPIAQALAGLTTQAKASLTSGADFWTTRAIPTAGIGSIAFSDGPHGLRKQGDDADHLGLAASIPATCFPPAVALGSSFDPELARRVGAALGTEALLADVAVVLGPGINIKRSPLCGRNFEYFSEDPLLTGAVAAGMVEGIQSCGVGASLKHFAVNNQESDRLRISAEVDERPLREIYLRGFERVVQQARPWTVMCSYNRINGVLASENPWLLTQVLREEWGFDGLVVSDWGAVRDRVAALAAGLNLQMPGGSGEPNAQVEAAVESGDLSPAVLDAAAERIVELVRRAETGRAEAQQGGAGTAGTEPAGVGLAETAASAPRTLDVAAHHAIAREAAGRGIVLLRNEPAPRAGAPTEAEALAGPAAPLLPLDPQRSVAVIGEFARTPRFQGGGSSHINPTRVDSALDALREALGERVAFAPGFAFNGGGDGNGHGGGGEAGVALREEAAALAAACDTAVVFLGLTDNEESEGYDRGHIHLPAHQLADLDAVLDANPRTVVVLSNGSVVALPFAHRAPAIVEAWLLGQAGGSATADVLLGAVNPSGRLAETIPLRLEDTPAFGNFPGELGRVRYGEGVFVGYRWYDKREWEVAYPFGHGLSYTAFAYGQPTARVCESGDIAVTVTVENRGERDGREVVQVYAHLGDSIVARPPRELRAFASVEIPAGQAREVEFMVRAADLAYWDERVGRFVVEPGTYRLDVGASSRDIRGSVDVAVAGEAVRPPLSMESTVAEVREHPVAGPLLAGLAGRLGAGEEGSQTALAMLGSIPIGRLPGFTGFGVERADVERLIATGNAEAVGDAGASGDAGAGVDAGESSSAIEHDKHDS
ncbi:glycoside hydrolase family 3 C-terminal domain-containing protein [Brevibacterium sp. BRM-1]|uniref:glycoside hydrolase family 3 C-terminal domain-containing protein n=1 Tax=Brevibacterium sp. BRM-1 TaxID=2999062 RepID=UPI0022831362|nr:glycoside hydrolase family 3 C-terminal domain-containing protein [Brevibacterium sp. BRM-1]WAL40401.1 glycoside hydrolase family 3 C-terminal domain-containing protein [Brevibacterium sp. BRM-1]